MSRRAVAPRREMDCGRQAVTKKKTLLQVAIETGFHSLVELFAKHENREAARNAALGDAVSLHRLDFVDSR
jgi:hypothetical protein